MRDLWPADSNAVLSMLMLFGAHGPLPRSWPSSTVLVGGSNNGRHVPFTQDELSRLDRLDVPRRRSLRFDDSGMAFDAIEVYERKLLVPCADAAAIHVYVAHGTDPGAALALFQEHS